MTNASAAKRQDLSQFCTVIPQTVNAPATIDCNVPNLTAADIDAIFANLDPEHCTRTAEGIDCALLSGSKAKRDQVNYGPKANSDIIALPIVIGSIDGVLGGGGGTPPALQKRQTPAITIPKDLVLNSGVTGTLVGNVGGPVSAPEVGPVKYEYGGFKLRPTDNILEQVGQPVVLNGGGLTIPVVKPVVKPVVQGP
jgi:hypothetical protein